MIFNYNTEWTIMTEFSQISFGKKELDKSIAQSDFWINLMHEALYIPKIPSL